MTEPRIQQSRIAEFSKKGKEIEVFADVREDGEITERLEELGAKITEKQLELGDFLISDRILIERKTSKDFEASIIDGRLFNQASRMQECEYEKPILIIEGKKEAKRIHQNAFLGATLSLSLDFGILIFFTKDKEETAELIFSIAKREQTSSGRPIRLIAKKKTNTIEGQQLKVLEAFPTIGHKTARKLLEKFTSLDAVFKADEKQLAQIIGKAKAKKMKELIIKKNLGPDHVQ